MEKQEETLELTLEKDETTPPGTLKDPASAAPNGTAASDLQCDGTAMNAQASARSLEAPPMYAMPSGRTSIFAENIAPSALDSTLEEDMKPGRSTRNIGKAEDQMVRREQSLITAREQGKIGERTVQDAMVLGGKAFNPDAVDQLGLCVLLGFRRKVFALLLLQSVAICAMATGIARIPVIVERRFLAEGKADTFGFPALYVDAGILGFVFLLTIIVLGVTSYNRHQHPLNMLLMSIFSVFFSGFMALVGGANCWTGLALVVICVVLIGLPSCMRCGSRAIEVFPVACFVALLTIPIGVGGWKLLALDIDGFWVGLVIVLNMMGMIWLGYEMDWICARLNPDEYFLPIVLVWSEVLTIVVIILLLVMSDGGGGDMGDAGGDCCCGDCLSAPYFLYCHCDCWLYNGGETSRKQYYRSLEQYRRTSQVGDGAESAALPPAQAWGP